MFFLYTSLTESKILYIHRRTKKLTILWRKEAALNTFFLKNVFFFNVFSMVTGELPPKLPQLQE